MILTGKYLEKEDTLNKRKVKIHLSSEYIDSNSTLRKGIIVGSLVNCRVKYLSQKVLWRVESGKPLDDAVCLEWECTSHYLLLYWEIYIII